MEFKLTLTREHLIKFHTKHLYKTKVFTLFKISLIIFNILFFLFCICFVNSKYTFLVVIVFSITILFTLLFRMKIVNSISKFIVNITVANYKDKFLFLPTIITINNNGITIKNKFNDNIIKWDGVKSVHIIENNILILTFVENNIVIPSEYIKGNDDIKLFIKLVETNISIVPEFTYPREINFDL